MLACVFFSTSLNILGAVESKGSMSCISVSPVVVNTSECLDICQVFVD